ncbi:hypothetical protein AZH51_00470 [Branchiibius sp. NY16-3462-2]|nr:hypothetical protein AZH51_00470 [Branchiibius sp. NY16-3462-2]
MRRTLLRVRLGAQVDVRLRPLRIWEQSRIWETFVAAGSSQILDVSPNLFTSCGSLVLGGQGV